MVGKVFFRGWSKRIICSSINVFGRSGNERQEVKETAAWDLGLTDFGSEGLFQFGSSLWAWLPDRLHRKRVHPSSWNLDTSVP